MEISIIADDVASEEKLEIVRCAVEELIQVILEENKNTLSVNAVKTLEQIQHELFKAL